MKRRIGKTQAQVHAALVRHRRWFHDCGWLWDTNSHTRQLMYSLVRCGLATVDTEGVFTPTEASILDGRVVLPTDTPTSHLRNALQISTLLAAEIPTMIGNPGYQDVAAKSLAAIDARIRAALELL